MIGGLLFTIVSFLFTWKNLIHSSRHAYCWLISWMLAFILIVFKPCWCSALSVKGKNGKSPNFPQSDSDLSFCCFTDQPRHCGLLSHPVQLVHAGEFAPRNQRPQPAACGPTGTAEWPLLPCKPHTHSWETKQLKNSISFILFTAECNRLQS